MSVIALTLALLLANRVKPSQIGITALNSTDVNTLESTGPIFALQIRQIRTTSEAPPAASAGNNLNVVEALDVPENSQAISTIYSFENKVTSGKKYDKGNVKLLSVFADESENNDKSVENYNENSVKPQFLVWENCFESVFRDSQSDTVKIQNDMEHTNNKQVDIENIQYNPSIWSKRNVNTNNSEAMKVWIDKYNNLKNGKVDERRQQKPESILLKKITEPLTTYSPSTTIKVVPITREIFKEPTESLNMTLDIVTENNIRAGYTEDWFEAKERTKIRFSGLPQTETYLIPTLKLEDGFHPFGFMSEFFSLIYPFEFPVGKLTLFVSFVKL